MCSAKSAPSAGPSPLFVLLPSALVLAGSVCLALAASGCEAPSRESPPSAGIHTTDPAPSAERTDAATDLSEGPVSYSPDGALADAGASARVETSAPPFVTESHADLFQRGLLRDTAALLGPHAQVVDGVAGYTFVVWAPNAQSVSVVGDFNGWDESASVLHRVHDAFFEAFVPGAAAGQAYQLSVLGSDGQRVQKSDPAGRFHQLRPGKASILYASSHVWADDAFVRARAGRDATREPLTIYEVHLPSWKRHPDGSMMTYVELAAELVPHLQTYGFNAVEIMGLSEHPLDDSWGYQVTGYYAPTSRHGTPDDFKAFVDAMHAANIRVIFDWVPAHFPKDAHGLALFDGTHLFDDPDPRRGEQLDWGTYVFNYARPEVRSFQLGGLAYMLDEYHLDGARVDAVASMLYLDYSRTSWLPNAMGGRENLDAVSFLRETNDYVHQRFPGVLMIAEESTAWPGVTASSGEWSLGFDFKWNMGWMHDTLDFFSTDPANRPGVLDRLTHTFSWLWSERFVLALSHDEVVYGKRSLLEKMPGSPADKLANLRVLFSYMTSYPGAKLLFMGAELAQDSEWDFRSQLAWAEAQESGHAGIGRLLADLDALYLREPALYDAQYAESAFELAAEDPGTAVVALKRTSASGQRAVLFVHNLSNQAYATYRIGVDAPGRYSEIFNSDASVYGGQNRGNAGGVDAEPIPAFDEPYSIALVLPPLTSLAFQRAPQL